MLIVANWKAYIWNAKEAKQMAAAARRLASRGKHTIAIAPSAPHLGLFPKKKLRSFAFAAQDVSTASGGAATGEIAAALLADLGVAYVIVGHSERRARGETDATIALKAAIALQNGLVPILCIGERTRDADARYLKELRAQLSAVLSGLAPKDRARIVIAYEPVWAIGKSALEAIAPRDLHEMALYIRKVLTEHVPAKAASKMRILYGGSVEPSNIRGLAKEGGVDGFLIGHASANAASFSALVKELS